MAHPQENGATVGRELLSKRCTPDGSKSRVKRMEGGGGGGGIKGKSPFYLQKENLFFLLLLSVLLFKTVLEQL